MSAPPYAGGLLVVSTGAFLDEEEARVYAKGMSETYDNRHWVMPLRTYGEPVTLSDSSGQLSFPEDWLRHRGQSDWGIDLALETARRWQ
jgi:hypothetical protein